MAMLQGEALYDALPHFARLIAQGYFFLLESYGRSPVDDDCNTVEQEFHRFAVGDVTVGARASGLIQPVDWDFVPRASRKRTEHSRVVGCVPLGSVASAEKAQALAPAGRSLLDALLDPKNASFV